MPKTLGLDIGPNSIGWAIIEQDQSESTGRLIDAGVRVFPAGVDNFDTSKEVSRNEDRRTARGMRRQIARRKRRRRILREALISAGLFPADSKAQCDLLNRNPYELRRRAVSEALEALEIGRVFLHLNQRRGFLSNSKKDKSDKEVQGMLAEINDLAKDMDGSTLGQHLAELQMDPHTRIRGKHTRRSMLVDEFDRIWRRQAKHHPKLFTDALRWGNSGPQEQPHAPRRLPQKSD